MTFDLKSKKYTELLLEVRSKIGVSSEKLIRSSYKGIDHLTDDAKIACLLALSVVDKKNSIQAETGAQKLGIIPKLSLTDNSMVERSKVNMLLSLVRVFFFLKRSDRLAAGVSIKKASSDARSAIALMNLSEKCSICIISIMSEGRTISRSLPAMAADASYHAARYIKC